MTVCVMRYISDLRIGRVNPQHFNFDINVADKKYDLAEFLSDNAVDATDVPALIASVEPDSDQYRKHRSRPSPTTSTSPKAAGRQAAAPTRCPPSPNGPLRAQQTQTVSRRRRTHLLRTRSQSRRRRPCQIAEHSTRPERHRLHAALSDAVKRYQHRHGLTDDGKLTPETIDSLNVPLTERVIQLQDSLERWRWLPDQYSTRRCMVNLPEFVLRGYNPTTSSTSPCASSSARSVGEHDTPVFTHMMKYLVFRPYWNVPHDIVRRS